MVRPLWLKLDKIVVVMVGMATLEVEPCIVMEAMVEEMEIVVVVIRADMELERT